MQESHLISVPAKHPFLCFWKVWDKWRTTKLWTGILVCSVLGMGLLPALDCASARLLMRGARVVPSRVQVGAALSLISLLPRKTSVEEEHAHCSGVYMNNDTLIMLTMPGAVMHASYGFLHGESLSRSLCMQVRAMLVEMRISDVCGFDLSGLNRYRWNPGHEKIDLSRRDDI